MTLTDGIAQLIGDEDDGVTGLVFDEDSGGNVFVGALPRDPIRAVAVYPRPGDEADSGLPYDAPHLQIVVRGDEDPVWALDMWQAIYDKLHGLANVTLPDGTYLVYALAMQSGPAHIGTDESYRYMYGMNLRTEIRNPTAERPTE